MARKLLFLRNPGDPLPLKIDLVMWTYNSAKTLETCLSSIDRAIPSGAICHKIAVDGGSQDNTADILRRYGWTVESSPRRGIPYQANLALGKVDAEFFASFEHDIVLNPNWFGRMSREIDSEARVGAVQGVRLYVGSKTMQAIDEWLYREKRIPVWTYSIDNTLFRTEAVKRAGGFSDECMASADGILRRNMFKLGYKWITDSNLISGHYRKNFYEQFSHQLRTFEMTRYYWGSNSKGSIPRRLISMLGGNPIHVLNMMVRSRLLRLPLGWYIIRLQRGFYQNLPHEDKSMRPVAMDEWYLTKFEKAVKNSSQSLADLGGKSSSISSQTSSMHACSWCGARATHVYSIPTDWGTIRPKLQGGVGQKFFACSEEHTEKVAETIFKSAFDFVSSEETNAGLTFVNAPIPRHAGSGAL